MLALPDHLFDRIVAHCLDELPHEACGLLAGHELADGSVSVELSLPATNASHSAKVYTVEPRDLLRADREAEAAGLGLVGVYHSHTHTAAYPSPTDVAQAPEPSWHYVIVSLASEPVMRSYRIVGGKIEEHRVVLQ